MPHTHHTHHNILSLFKNRELNELYATLAIRAIAVSMIAIFIPLFLLGLGYSMNEVLIYYIVTFGSVAIVSILAVSISIRFGTKHSIIFSMPLLIVYFLLLATLETQGWPLWIVAAIGGTHGGLFWFGYHATFAKFAKEGRRGKQVGVSQFLSASFHAIGPLVGGFLLLFTPFSVLFLVVAFLIVLATIPLFFSEDGHGKIKFSWKAMFRHFHFREAITFLGYGVDVAVSSTVWPVFIFLYILDSYAQLGLVASITLFVSMLSIAVVSIAADKRRRLVMRLGAACNVVIWAIKASIGTLTGVFAMDTLHGATRTAIYLPMDAATYKRAKKGNVMEMILTRQFMLHIGGALLFGILLLAGGNLILGLYIAAAASILYFFF